MRPGDTVTVLDINDNKLVRTVVAVENEMVYVSRREEVERARAERREPVCIGFRLSDVVRHKSRE
jgi:hypothetical protein